jgi:PadR family transcriptional regulator PadR
MRKGMLEYCIMLILKQRSCYANDIIRELKEADMIVVEGTLYPLLNRLLKERILKYEWQESTQGPPRKYYSLTLDGEEVLRQLNSSWLEISNTVNKLHEQ